MDRERLWRAWVRRLHNVYVTTALLGVHPDPDRDVGHQRADEGDPMGLAIQRLRHEEQRIARTQLMDLARRALEEEIGIFEGDLLIEKSGAGAPKDD
jgi:hypothetical protein